MNKKLKKALEVGKKGMVLIDGTWVCFGEKVKHKLKKIITRGIRNK